MRRALLLCGFSLAMAIVAPAQPLTTLYSFCSQQNCRDGSDSRSALVRATDGNFYGTTADGGAKGEGTVFGITPDGTLTTLYSFCMIDDCSDGSQPLSSLVQYTDGSFYGTTSYVGTVFKILADGSFTTIYTFCKSDCSDGGGPTAGLAYGSDGNFYGVTRYGGSPDSDGTVFKITPDGMLTTLYRFCPNAPNCSDGATPLGGLVQGKDGDFYGTTSLGGAHSHGTVFKIAPGGMLTTLYSFCALENCADGKSPLAKLVQGTDGNFYGTTPAGGANGWGTVFTMTPEGALTTLYSFCSQPNCADGLQPFSELVQGTDGNFYGTTTFGGVNEAGTVFKITSDGTLTTIYSFCSEQQCNDGAYSYTALLQTTDGSFYGTTSSGGKFANGIVFRLMLYPALSVSKSGKGTVGSVDGHIYCGSACLYLYKPGTQVTLSAVPALGYTFSGWSGCDNMNGSYCSVTMSDAKNVAATFESVSNLNLTSLTFKPTYVRGGRLSAGTLTLSGPAPEGGLGVALSSDHPGVVHPPSFVVVPGGKSSVGFPVNTFRVKSETTVMITATVGSSEISGTLVVGATFLPPSVK